MPTHSPLPRTIWMIRHAESAGNAGLRSKSSACIPLSPLGCTQAQRLAEAIGARPDLVVTSRYSRTLETAGPLLERFPGVPHEVWDLHEFTYLNATKYDNTTQRERGESAQEFWDSCDPDYHDGPGAESFREFMGRVDRIIGQILSREEAFTICFSHAFFIKGVIWRICHPTDSITGQAMADFLRLHRECIIRNARIYPFAVQDELVLCGQLDRAADDADARLA